MSEGSGTLAPHRPRGIGGCSGFLPPDPADCGVDAFDVTVADLIRTAGSDPDEGALLAPASVVDRRKGPRPQRLLIVDDSADIRELWRLWLTFWGFSVDEACNGHDAIRKATEFQPDLILMDLWMPVVDGIEAMRRLKADSRTSHVPVLAVSAQTHAPDSSTALAAGADAVLIKPCDPDQLLDHIRLAMGRLRPA